jgi:hypothetical protein
MEEIQIEIKDTKRKIEVAERAGDIDYVKTLTEYLIELQKEKNILLSAPAGNCTFEFLCFTSIVM